NETISGLMGSKEGILPLGYVPCGSTNDFAATLGISTDPEKAAEAIVRSEGMAIDLGRFMEEHYFSYIASFGAFTQASYSAPQDLKNIVGHMAYIIEGIKDLSSITPYKVSVEAEGVSCSGNYIFGSVSNTRSVGGIVKLKEDEIGLDDGLFEIILVKYPETPLDFSNLVTGIFSSDFSSDVFEYFKASKVSFTMPRKLYWSLDGEKVRGGNKVEISNMHRVLTLLK
ncbi:MAG: diacylglycerol kinase family lipid kinase, partial [Firmicutes bacterium]|nr:diacylglycerol kinase family lipid kinase [Bacillota bacterium]